MQDNIINAPTIKRYLFHLSERGFGLYFINVLTVEIKIINKPIERVDGSRNKPIKKRLS